MKVICFHNSDEKNGVFSNWYMYTMVIDSKRFTSMEQYLMYSKAILFNDTHIAKRIMSTNDVAKIKELGRKVSGFDDDVWKEYREKIVCKGLRVKFAADSPLHKYLMQTEGSILAECAVRDTVCGIGLSMIDPNRFDKSKWRGQNLLGRCLMQVREEFRK